MLPLGFKALFQFVLHIARWVPGFLLGDLALRDDWGRVRLGARKPGSFGTYDNAMESWWIQPPPIACFPLKLKKSRCSGLHKCLIVFTVLWYFVLAHGCIFSPQNVEAVKAKGAALVDSLSTYTNVWHTSRSSAKQRLITAPGDALVTAAAVCYLGPLIPAAREELFSDWLRVCDGTSRDPEKRPLSLSSMILDDTRNKSNYVDHNYTGKDPSEIW